MKNQFLGDISPRGITERWTGYLPFPIILHSRFTTPTCKRAGSPDIALKKV